MRKLFTFFFLLISTAIYPAIQPGAVWEYRPTGNNNNGGGYDSTIAGAGTDYSLQGNAIFAQTDLTCATGSVTVNTTAGVFTSAMVGNCGQLTSATRGTTGYYFITEFISSKNVKLDRSPQTGTSGGMINGVFNVGGAWATPSDAQWEAFVSGNIAYLYGANTYTLTGGLSIASLAGKGTNPIEVIGYNTVRGDNPTGSNRPIIANGGNSINTGNSPTWRLRNIIFTGSVAASYIVNIGSYSQMYNCKLTNTNTNTSSSALSLGTDAVAVLIEATCPSGNAILSGAKVNIYKSVVRNSNNGVSCSTNGCAIFKSVFFGNKTSDISLSNGTTTHGFVQNCIFYGAGIGISLGTSNSVFASENIFHTKTTGVSDTATNNGFFAKKNLFYNCGTNATNVTLDSTNITGSDPLFTNPGSADFTLSSSTSPCINAGIDISNAGLTGSYKPQIGIDEDNNTRTTHSFAR